MAAAAALPMDPVWLGPVGEQGQEAHLQFLYGAEGVVPRASADRADDPVPPVRVATATFKVNRDEALKYLRLCGVKLGPMHEANKNMHDTKSFAIHRWAGLTKSLFSAQKSFVEGCTTTQQRMLIAVAHCHDGKYNMTTAPEHMKRWNALKPGAHDE